MKVTTCLIAAAIGLSPAAAAAATTARLVSVAPDGTQANGPSHFPALSENGQCVAYESDASNLVAGDTNGVTDIFVFDRQTSVTTRESLGFGGAQGNGASHRPAVSGDCRLVAFQSDASNLVPGVSGTQIYIRDRQIGLTLVASVSTAGVAANGSAGGTKEPSISADGQALVFVSDASNLVSGDTNRVADVFTRNFAAGVTTRESVAPNGAQLATGGANPFLTANGRYVAFASARSVYLRDRSMGKTWVALSETGSAVSPSASVSGDGRYVVFVTGGNATYFHDRLAGKTTLLSFDSCCHNSFTGYATPRVASDGRLVFQRAKASSALHLDATYITVYGADLTVVGGLSILHKDIHFLDALEPPSVAGDAIAYATTGSMVTSDTNVDYDVYLDRLDLTGPMSPPMNLAFSLTGSMLTLTWTPPAVGVPTSYLIEAGSSPGAADLGRVQTGPANTYVTSIVEGSRFYVRVRATNASGTGNPSNEVVVSAAPGMPTNLLATANGSTIALTWSAPESGGAVSHYTIRISPSPSICFFQCSPEAVATTSATSVTVNGVPSSNSPYLGVYSVTVTASNDSGSSGASNMAIAIVGGACTRPDPPTGLAADVNGSRVTLTWTAGAGGTSYVLQAGSGPGRTDLLSSDLGSPATTLVTSGVPPGRYFVSLRSRTPCGDSAASDEVLVTVR